MSTTVRGRRRSSGKMRRTRTFGPQQTAVIAAVSESTSVGSESASSVGSEHGADSNVIADWLKHHNLWFAAGKGAKLLMAMVTAGIERPDEDLAVLSEHPDLHDIAAMASLNLLQRRRFIDCAHPKETRRGGGNGGGGGGGGHGDDHRGKVMVVMRAEEQVGGHGA